MFMWIPLITLLLGQLISASLIPRQLSAPLDVPPACNNNCSELNTILSSCSAVSCFCTELLLDDYASCFICLGGLTDASLDTPQQILNGIVTECSQDGVFLTPVILPGEPSTAAPVPPTTPQSSNTLSTSSSSASTSSATSSSSSSSTTSSITSSTPSLTPSSQQSSSSIQKPNAVLPTPTQQSSNSTLPPDVSPPAVSETSGSERIAVSVAAGVMAFSLFLGFLC